MRGGQQIKITLEQLRIAAKVSNRETKIIWRKKHCLLTNTN
jgi:hypothetical protein